MGQEVSAKEFSKDLDIVKKDFSDLMEKYNIKNGVKLEVTSGRVYAIVNVDDLPLHPYLKTSVK